MTFMEWEENMSVGVPSIDDQHQKLVKAINALFDAIEQRKTDGVLLKVFKALQAYTVIHFEYEEKLFAEHGYPDAASHSEIHEKLIVQLKELIAKRGEASSIELSVETMDFLREWLFEHIMHEDRKYSSFLIEKGVK